MSKAKEWVTLLPNDVSGFQVIRIDKGLFKNIEYTYGAVAFEEGDDDLTLKFEYNIRTGNIAPMHEESFKQFTGEILCAIMSDQIDNEEVIYANGTGPNK